MLMKDNLYLHLRKKRILGYRRFKRLSSKEKRLYLKSPLSVNEKVFALLYKAYSKCSLKEALEFSSRYYEDYHRYFSRKSNYIPVKRETNLKYIYKEFIFQGFVPEDTFKKKRNRHYLISNRPILGTTFIYPVHAWHDIRYKSEGEPWIYELLNKVGVPGYTRIDLYYKI